MLTGRGDIMHLSSGQRVFADPSKGANSSKVIYKHSFSFSSDISKVQL